MTSTFKLWTTQHRRLKYSGMTGNQKSRTATSGSTLGWNKWKAAWTDTLPYWKMQRRAYFWQRVVRQSQTTINKLFWIKYTCLISRYEWIGSVMARARPPQAFPCTGTLKTMPPSFNSLHTLLCHYLCSGRARFCIWNLSQFHFLFLCFNLILFWFKV